MYAVDKTNNFYNFICGKLLGDGCITKQDNRKPRFQFMHRTEGFGWADYCYNQLKNHIPLSPPTYGKIMDDRLINGFSERFTVQSRTVEIITGLHKIWYPNGEKVLPFDFIERYLDKSAIAWWYQDDGHLKIVNGIVNKLILSTDSFSIEENTKLVELLNQKFKIRFSLDGQNRLILYDQFQIIYFLHIVSPWLHESMVRKWLPNQPIHPIAKRTTIYLPTEYLLIKPTAEINTKLDNLTLLLNPSTQKVCPENIFSIFHNRLAKKENIEGYQIIIDEHHRHSLANIRQQTGLTISKLTEFCFWI